MWPAYTSAIVAPHWDVFRKEQDTADINLFILLNQNWPLVGYDERPRLEFIISILHGLTPSARICMAMILTTMEQKWGGGEWVQPATLCPSPSLNRSPRINDWWKTEVLSKTRTLILNSYSNLQNTVLYTKSVIVHTWQTCTTILRWGRWAM